MTKVTTYNDYQPYAIPRSFPKSLQGYPFAFSPNTTEITEIARRTADQLGFENIVGFTNESEMRKHLQQANFYNKTDEMLERMQSQLKYYEVDLNYTSLNQFLHGEYKQKYLEYVDAPAQQSAVGIHYNVTDGALDYTCYYNQQMLDDYHSLNYDRSKAMLYPHGNFSFSPYGFSVQIAVESQFLEKEYDY